MRININTPYKGSPKPYLKNTPRIIYPHDNNDNNDNY